MNTKNRKETEDKLINSISEIINSEGINGVGINSVAEKSGVSKVLIYRYFGNMDGLMMEFVNRTDFWKNIYEKFEQIKLDEVNPQTIKKLIFEAYRLQLEEFRNNLILREIMRYQLINRNQISEHIGKIKEEYGYKLSQKLINLIEPKYKVDYSIFLSATVIITASISYIVLIADNYNIYNGIELDNEQGWQKIESTISIIVDLLVNHIGIK